MAMTSGAFRLLTRLPAVARESVALLRLPRRVRQFYLRALLTAWRTGDNLSLVASARPYELRRLLELARTAVNVVELGTGTAWTAIALILDDERRRVITYDPIERDRSRYLRLVSPSIRDRIELRSECGEVGPSEPMEVELLFIDIGQHRSETTFAAFEAWEPSVVVGGIVVFHDYGEKWPGVREAVERLGLEGDISGVLFSWRKRSATVN
jgi:hypothetical protein